MKFEAVVGILAIFVRRCRITYIEHIELTSIAEFHVIDIVDCHRGYFLIHKRRLLKGAITVLISIGIVVAELIEAARLGNIHIAFEFERRFPRHRV